MDMSDLNLPWLESPFFEKLLARSDLDPQARELARTFARDGFLLFDPEIPDFDALAASILEACSKRPDYPQRVTDAWPEIEGVRRLALCPAVLSLLRTLYRREPIPMQTLNFGRGTEQRPHSDSMHFSSVPRGFMCGVWIALEDVDERNGALEYYPGSHRLPYFDHSSIGLTGSDQKGYEGYGTYEEFVGLVIAELGFERRVLRMRKGQALVWAANLLHGGSPIQDPSRSRHSQVTHYFFEGCLYYQPQRSDPFLGRVLWLDKRDVRTGELIPQVYNGKPARVRRGLGGALKHLARRAGLDRTLRSWLRRGP
jgi:Phytanoyl-CoA dioxygenase (PhyH)